MLQDDKSALSLAIFYFSYIIIINNIFIFIIQEYKLQAQADIFYVRVTPVYLRNMQYTVNGIEQRVELKKQSCDLKL